MARKSAIGLVLSQMIPVDPDGTQPTYIRSARSIQTSADLRALQACVGDVLEDANFNDRSEVRDAFSQAATGCKNNDYNPGDVSVSV